MISLRRILIFFGWAIPVTIVLGIFIGLFNLNTIANFKEAGSSASIWEVLGLILGSVKSLALSPLCFFGAHMLKRGA